MNQKTTNLNETLNQYCEIKKLTTEGKPQEALQKLDASSLESSTKELLKDALQSGEDYVIKRVFSELDARLNNALCWNCWRD